MTYTVEQAMACFLMEGFLIGFLAGLVYSRKEQDND